MEKNPHSHFLYFVIFLAPLFLSSCASVPTIQSQVNSLVVSDNLISAIEVLNTQGALYGKNNALLYYMDKGMVFHLASRYKESITAFEKAKAIIDELYTKSLSKFAATWFMNDYSAPYRGENFEHILVNVFQALNFVAQDNISEALVEARDMDLKLTAIQYLYANDKKDAYLDDAFARFFMGILYEATGNSFDLNDAYISYKKALDAYESNFYKSQGVQTPNILKENILAVSKALDSQGYQNYRKKFPEVNFPTMDEKEKKCEVYLIQYNGLSPIKHPSSFYIPLPAVVTKLSFPKYDTRDFDIKSSVFKAAVPFKLTVHIKTELGDNIETLALKDLEIRKFGIYAKAIGRPIFKYLVEQGLENKADQKYGNGAAYGVAGASSLYNIYSERADLRSWQTLPAQIRIARLLLTPGTYHLYLENLDNTNNLIEEDDLGEITLQAGQKKFILKKTVK